MFSINLFFQNTNDSKQVKKQTNGKQKAYVQPYKRELRHFNFPLSRFLKYLNSIQYLLRNNWNHFFSIKKYSCSDMRSHEVYFGERKSCQNINNKKQDKQKPSYKSIRNLLLRRRRTNCFSVEKKIYITHYLELVYTS